MEQARVIIDYSQDSPEHRRDLLRHALHLHEYFREHIAIEVMAYGQGLDLVLKEGGLHGDDVQPAITLLACRNTMKSRSLSDDAIASAHIVGSGLGRLVERQMEGWAYLKAS